MMIDVDALFEKFLNNENYTLMKPKKTYISKNEYSFNINNDKAVLLINNIVFEITHKSILEFDKSEMIYGVLPAVIKFAKPLFSSYKNVPKFFSMPETYIPAIYMDDTPYVDNRTLALLHLILFYKNIITIKDAKLFINKYGNATDVAHIYRNLSYNVGLYVLQGKNNEFAEYGFDGNKNKSGYALWSLYEPKPIKIANRQNLDNNIWLEIKKRHNFTCDLCGSIEGQPHKNNTASITTLQAGHIKPHLPLDEHNCVPHCQHCNRKIKNLYTLDMYKNNETALFIEHQYIKSMFITKQEFIEYIKNIAERIYDN